MSLDDKIEKISKIDEITKKLDAAEEIGGVESVGGKAAQPRVAPNPDHFEALMQQGKKVDSTLVVENAEAKPSPMKEVEALNMRLDKLSQADPETIKSQARDLIVKLDDLKEQLNTPNLEIKGSVQTLLRNKLTHINDSLRIALSKAGVEYVPTQQTTNTINPIERFIGYLTQGQYQLQHLTDSVEQMQVNKKDLSPANMLAIQIKVGYIQQEIEFFTSLLNKALESTKTVMNVQV